MAADLNTVLNEEIMRRVNVVDSEYLKTIFIAIGRQQKEGFEKNVEKLGSELVGYGGPDWSEDPSKLGKPVSFGTQVDRHKVRGSPVVPGSTQIVHSDEESILYAVTILKGQYEAGYYENDEFQAGTYALLAISSCDEWNFSSNDDSRNEWISSALVRRRS